MGLKAYFQSLQNLLDFSLLTLSTFYLIIRIINPHQFIFPLGVGTHLFQTVDPELLSKSIETRMNYKYEDRIISQTSISIISAILFIFYICKILILGRFNRQIRIFSHILYKVLTNKQYLIFIGLFIILMNIFSILNLILGNTYPTEILYKGENRSIKMTAGEYQDLWYALGVGYVTVR